MQTITKTFGPVPVPDVKSAGLHPADLMLFDIETTGLSPDHAFIYLIGCIAFGADGTRFFTQYLVDSEEDEKEVLENFFGLASGARALVSYNGERFDLPFIQKRCTVLGIPDRIENKESIDLLKIVRPIRGYLGLFDLKQTTVEAYFGTGRTEETSGGDLIRVYFDYMKTGSGAEKEALLSHNEADVLGLSGLMPLIAYKNFFETPLRLYKAEARKYSAYDESEGEELLLCFHIEDPLSKPILASRGGCFLRADGSGGFLKVPLFETELKYFYADYKEYWYFPEEDLALHRSVAQFSDRTHREPATARTCYTRKLSSFLPEWSRFAEPVFKKDFDDPGVYFELTEERKHSRAFFSGYAQYVLKYIVNGQ